MLYSYTYVHTDDGDDDDMLFSFGREAGYGVHEEIEAATEGQTMFIVVYASMTT